MAVAGILADVTPKRVRGLLLERAPALVVDADPDMVDTFENLVRGAAVEVVLLTGPDPAVGPIRDLAVEAIANQTASEIEYATYPEQQSPGDIGRGWHLHQRYLELLARLRGLLENSTVLQGDGSTYTPPSPTTAGRPRGRFSTPLGYPDPIQVRGRSW